MHAICIATLGVGATFVTVSAHAMAVQINAWQHRWGAAAREQMCTCPAVDTSAGCNRWCAVCIPQCTFARPGLARLTVNVARYLHLAHFHRSPCKIKDPSLRTKHPLYDKKVACNGVWEMTWPEWYEGTC